MSVRNIIEKCINWLIPKRKKYVFVTPHSNTQTDCVDLENFAASNVLSFLRYCLANKQVENKFFIVVYNSARIQALTEKFKGANCVFVKSHNERGISKLERIKRWVRQAFRSARCAELWSETGGTYRSKTRRQKVVCFHYFIPFKNDYFTNSKPWSDVDYLLSVSKLSSQIMSVATHIPYNKIHEVGFPRIQELVENTRKVTRGQIDALLGCEGKRIIIYAPTYRPSTDSYASTFGYVDENIVEQTLSKMNAIVLLKKHPLDKRGGNSKYCIDFQPNEKISIYDVMKHADLMVSDYSSIGYDFAMLGKPVILNWYDEKEYLRDRGLSYEPMEPFAPGKIARTSEELAMLLADYLSGELLPPNIEHVCRTDNLTKTNERVFQAWQSGWKAKVVINIDDIKKKEGTWH